MDNLVDGMPSSLLQILQISGRCEYGVVLLLQFELRPAVPYAICVRCGSATAPWATYCWRYMFGVAPPLHIGIMFPGRVKFLGERLAKLISFG